MKLWLDDVRKPPDASWTWCRTAQEAFNFVSSHECEEWALDHDLGGQQAHYGKGPYEFNASGYMFLIYAAKCPLPDRISIHSTNSSGVSNMVAILHELAIKSARDIEIIVRPMRGRIMDKTPYYEEATR